MTVTQAMNQICKNGNANICYWIGQKVIKAAKIAFIAYGKFHLKQICYESYIVYYAQDRQIKQDSFSSIEEAEKFFDEVKEV